MEPAPMTLPGCELRVNTGPPLSPSPSAMHVCTSAGGLAQLADWTAYQTFTQTLSSLSKTLVNVSTVTPQWTPVQEPEVHTERPPRFEARPATGLAKSCASA